MSDVDRFEAMPPMSQGIRGCVVQREIQDDGTIVVMRHGETAIAALLRHCRITKSNDVRMWKKYTPYLFRAGFFYIEGDRIKLAKFVELQAWQHKRGPVPVLYVETPDDFDADHVFDMVSGAMVDPADLARETPSATSGRRQDDVRTTSGQHRDDVRDNPSARDHSGSMRKSARFPSSSSSASKEQEVTYRQDVTNGGAPHGCSSPHGIPPPIEDAPLEDTDEDVDAELDVYRGDTVDPFAVPEEDIPF